MRNKHYDDPFCVDVDKAILPWLVAIEAADTNNALRRISPSWRERPKTKGCATDLIKLLRSKRPIPKEVRELLADLLERHVLEGRQGRPRTPAYTGSIKEVSLSGASAEYRMHLKLWPETDGDQLLEQLSDDFDLPNSKSARRNRETKGQTLRNYLNGKRGSSRRKR